MWKVRILHLLGLNGFFFPHFSLRSGVSKDLGPPWWHFLFLLKQNSSSANKSFIGNWLVFPAKWKFLNLESFFEIIFSGFSVSCACYWLYLLLSVVELDFQIQNLPRHESILEKAAWEQRRDESHWAKKGGMTEKMEKSPSQAVDGSVLLFPARPGPLFLSLHISNATKRSNSGVTEPGVLPDPWNAFKFVGSQARNALFSHKFPVWGSKEHPNPLEGDNGQELDQKGHFPPKPGWFSWNLVTFGFSHRMLEWLWNPK